MAFVLDDRVRESTSTSGTADFIMSGVVTGGFVTFASRLSNNDTTYYCAENRGASQFEVGLGTWNAGTVTLARTTVLANSLGTTAKITFSNSPQVFITIPGTTNLERAINPSNTSLLSSSRAFSVSAAGTVQGDATALSSTWNVVTTVASGAGVILPSSGQVWVRNSGANALKVYPPSGGAINALSTNAAATVAVGAAVLFDTSNGTQWYTF
jgi:hypothetical protein